jgi:MFS family permease
MMTGAKSSDLPPLSFVGKITILLATAVALLSTPLAAPAMTGIVEAFTDQAQNEPFALAIMALVEAIFGETGPRFLVKFVLLSVPALFIIIGAPVTGWICDRWGRKSLLNVSLVVFGISGVSTYWADSFLFMFVGRAILGIAIAGIKTSTVAMVGDFFVGEERKKFLGWQGSAVKFGGLGFMLIGGYLAELDWQSPFLGYLLSFVLLPFVIFKITESMPEKGPSTIASRAAYKLEAIPKGPALFVFISATLASALFFVTPVQLRFFYEDKFGLSPLYFSWAVVVANGMGALVSIWYNKVKSRLNYTSIYALVFGTMGLGYLILTLMPGYYSTLLGMLIAGIGFGLFIPNQSDWIMSFTAPSRRGMAVGLVTTAMFMGQFLSALLIEPFVVENNPDAVWQSLAAFLGVLTVLYIIFGLIEKKRGSWQVKKHPS